MPDVVKHAWTHRPRSQGGTDPLPVAGAAGEWIRLGFNTDYVVPVGTRELLDFDVVNNHDPDTYWNGTLGESPEFDPTGTGPTIQVLKEGVYAVTWSLYVDVFTPKFPTNVPIWVSFQRTTWTVEEEVFGFPALQALGSPGTQPGFSQLGSPILTGTKVFRAGVDWDNIYMAVTIGDDADDDLGIVGGDLNISYFEIVRLVPLDEEQGNPNTGAVFPT